MKKLFWLTVAIIILAFFKFSIYSSYNQEWFEAVEFMREYNLSSTATSLNEYQPFADVKREAAAKLFVNLAKNIFQLKPDNSKKCEFKDINKASSFFQSYIIQACKYWLLKWTKDGYFLPKQQLKKHQFLTVLARMIKNNPSIEPKNAFSILKQEWITKENSFNSTVRKLSRIELALLFKRISYKYKNKKVKNSSFFKDPISAEVTDKINEQVVYKATEPVVNISFSAPMDRQSVEKNIKIYPDVPFETKWKDNKTVSIKLNQDDLTGEDLKEIEYILNIPENTLKEDWQPIWKPIVKKWKTSPVAKVVFVSPSWKITNLNKSITVRFNKPIVKLTTFQNQPPCPIQIVPFLPWKCVWITTSTFQFRPDWWFPVWAKYIIKIPAWIQTIQKDKTTNSMEFMIKTPDFKLLSSPTSLDVDQPLTLSFNAPVNLEDFKKTFSISNFNNNQLNIKYFEEKHWQITKQLKNIITVFPKQWDWWYDKTYRYKIVWLTSARWTLPLNRVEKVLKIQPFLKEYRPFVLLSGSVQNKFNLQNMKFAKNKEIIKPNNPYILFTFATWVELNKNLFEANTDFNIFYAKKYDCSSNCKYIDDKTNIVFVASWNIENLNIKLNINKLSPTSDNLILSFHTKKPNQIISYKQIDYRKACIRFSNSVEVYDNIWKNFKLSDYWEIYSMYKVSKYYQQPDCPYVSWQQTYILNMLVNPNTSYSLTIDKNLLDQDNYKLDKSYSLAFKTPPAKSEDQAVSFMDNRWFILIPEYLQPLTVWIKTQNLDKITLKVCEWDFDITENNFISNPTCKEKDVSITNLWFRTTFTVVDLNSLFGNKFTKSAISVQITYPSKEKTRYYYWYANKIIFIRTNISALLKIWEKKSVLWLFDYASWKNITNNIKSIKLYDRKYDYTTRKYYNKYIKDLDFVAKSDWLYELPWTIKWDYVLINTNNWKQILLETNNYYSYVNRNYTYIYTDKPLYKQSDTVHIKWIVRYLEDSWFIVKNNWPLLIEIKDPTWKTVKTDTIQLSNMWSFEYSWQIPKDAKLGRWTINVNGETAYIQVQQYEKPDFQVKVALNKDYYLYWQKAQAIVSADYYAWMDLVGWDVNYNISCSRYYFDWWKTSWYIWWEHNSFWLRPLYYPKHPQYISSFDLASWKAKTDQNWQANITVDLVNKTDKQPTNQLCLFNATVQDPNTKKTISASNQFKLFATDTFVGMKFDKYWYEYGDNAKIEFITVDPMWNKIWNQNIQFNVYKIEYTKNPQTYRYEQKQTKIYSKQLTTNSSWKAFVNYQIADYGKIKFEVTIPGSWWKTTKTFYIWWQDLIKPKEDLHKINIIANKQSYNVWEKANITIQTSFTWKAILTVEKLWTIFDYKIIDIASNNYNYNLPIKETYLPNVYVKVYQVSSSYQNSIEQLKQIRLQMQQIEQQLFSDYQNPYIILPIRCYDIVNPIIIPHYENQNYDKNLLKQLAQLRKQEHILLQKLLPNYWLGEINLKINTDYIKLKTVVSTDKNQYLPADIVNISLNITDKNNNPINGEWTVVIVDKALLDLIDENNKNIVDFFYSEKDDNIKTDYNLKSLIKRIEFVLDENDNKYKKWAYRSKWVYTDGLSAKAWWIQTMALEENIAPMSAEDSIASDKSSTNKIRQDFKDIAYYIWKVKIENWQATITVPKLPDDLTTWVIKWFVFTKDTKLWNINWQFKTQKPLMIIPSVPRFFFTEDKPVLSVVVANNTDQSLTVQATANITNWTIENSSQTITIPANSQKTVSWQAYINSNSDNTTLTFNVAGWTLQDTVQITRPIYPYETPEYTFTNWSITDVSYEDKIFVPENIKNWSLDISLWASILTNISDKLQNILYIPSESLYSKTEILYRLAVLKNFYNAIHQLNQWSSIKIKDYNNKIWTAEQIVQNILNSLAKYQQTDGWFAYYTDCIPWSYKDSCSDYYLTMKLLKTSVVAQKAWFSVEQQILNKAINYFKKETKKQLEEAKKYWYTYKNIEAFYTLALLWEQQFVKDNIPDYTDLNNYQKSLYVLTLQQIQADQNKIKNLIEQLKNDTFIEARWTLLPAWSFYDDDLLSTANLLQILINSKETEKLLVENLARWIVQQKDDSWAIENVFKTAKLLETITNYILYTKELENIDFTATAYLNNQALLSGYFNMKNKFDIIKKSFKLADYLKIGEDNSLWFTLQWTWKLYYDVGLKYYLPVETIKPQDEWIVVSRKIYKLQDYKDAFEEYCPYIWYDTVYTDYYMPFGCTKQQVKELQEVKTAKKWDLLVVEVEVVVPFIRNNVEVLSYIPAWTSIVNTLYKTASADVKKVSWAYSNRSYWHYSNWTHTEVRNNMMYLYAKKLYRWTYKYTFVVQVNQSWTYHLPPTVAYQTDRPEIWWRSDWRMFEVEE